MIHTLAKALSVCLLMLSLFVNTYPKNHTTSCCTSQWPSLNSDFINNLLGHESLQLSASPSVKSLQTCRLETLSALVTRIIHFGSLTVFVNLFCRDCTITMLLFLQNVRPGLHTRHHLSFTQKLWASNELQPFAEKIEQTDFSSLFVPCLHVQAHYPN
jgi:hypothetical protein